MKKMLICLAVLFLFSCTENEILEVKQDLNEKENTKISQRIFIGDSLVLENPYSISNMSKVFQKLKRNNPESSFFKATTFEVKPSHLYIKFKPKNEEEEGVLKSDATMHLFDYRLDVEYKDGYLENRKPANDSIPDYYTAISVNKTLPNVAYEIIEPLYIPEQDVYFKDTYEVEKYLITDKINSKTDFYNHLLYYAFVDTNNEADVVEENTTNQRWIFGKRWTPKGTITIHDDILKQIPLEGAKILMRQWFTVDSGITNANGYFQTGSVRGHARYIIQWERADYSIRSGWIGQAELRGAKLKNQDWNQYIDSGAQKYYGTIHRAAHYYFYKNIDGLRRPPNHSFWRSQIKIHAYLTNGHTYNASLSHIQDAFLGAGLTSISPWPTISIKRYSSNSSQLFGTTIHELAHSTHARHRGLLRFLQSEGRLIETYAQTIEWYLTTKMYRDIRPDLGIVFEDNYQFKTLAENPKYTSLMVDLIDDFNQSLIYYYVNNLPIDNVKGYTINQIEDEVMQTKTFSELKSNLINNYTNPTEGNLTELFNNW